MNRRIDETLIEEIRQRIDIVDEINQYVPLKRSGQNYKGLCPFHNEKSPSFMVHPEKQIYRCFGCGEGGNVFSFLMNYHGQSFMDVLKELARQCGVSLAFSEEAGEQEKLRSILRQINREALDFYQWALKHPSGEEARQYIQSRGISQEMQTRFGLGYAPNSWSALHQQLQSKGFTHEELAVSGLFGSYEKKDGLYDMFRHRVIFPIFDVYDETIGFGGRTLMEQQVKYINSPETALYQKGKHIYGLNLAKHAIRQRDQVLLVEGYMDVITAHQFGFEQAVATLGTALTPQQALQLIRFTPGKNVVISYDADAAGQKAADRGIEILEEATQGTGILIRVLTIPNQEDPDTFLHSQGSQVFQMLLDTASPFIEYQLDQALNTYNLKEPLAKAAAVQKCLPIISHIQDAVYRDECLRLLAERLNIRETALRDELRNFSRKNKKSPVRSPNKREPTPEKRPLPSRDKTYRSEIGLLYLMVENADQRGQIADELVEIQFSDEINEQLRIHLLDLYHQEQSWVWDKLFDHFMDTHIHQRLVEMMESSFLKEIDFEKSLADFLRNVKLKCLNVQIERLGRQIKHAETSKDSVGYIDLMKKYTGLIKAYTKLKETYL